MSNRVMRIINIFIMRSSNIDSLGVHKRENKTKKKTKTKTDLTELYCRTDYRDRTL